MQKHEAHLPNSHLSSKISEIDLAVTGVHLQVCVEPDEKMVVLSGSLPRNFLEQLAWDG